MTRFLGNLCGYLSNDLVKELVIGILTACPDQLQYFLPNFTDSVVPRLTKKWIDSMEFLIKVSLPLWYIVYTPLNVAWIGLIYLAFDLLLSLLDQLGLLQFSCAFYNLKVILLEI
jgi:hypothetical protein